MARAVGGAKERDAANTVHDDLQYDALRSGSSLPLPIVSGVPTATVQKSVTYHRLSRDINYPQHRPRSPLGAGPAEDLPCAAGAARNQGGMHCHPLLYGAVDSTARSAWALCWGLQSGSISVCAMICGASRNITDHKLWMRTRGGGTQKQGQHTHGAVPPTCAGKFTWTAARCRMRAGSRLGGLYLEVEVKYGF
jgi:hypothetical protein